MILSVWKPISKNSIISHFDIMDKECLLVKKGTTGYKVIWICDNPNCRTPNNTHSINACHLTKKNMCYTKQICRPCQVSGEGNGRYGDRRKWRDLFGDDKLNEMKIKYSDKWKGELNPSKNESVKIKKNQIIINEEFIKQICKDINFELIDLIKLDGKKTKFNVKCVNGHISEKIYSSFSRKYQKWKCSRCYYDSLGVNFSEEDIFKFEKYLKKVRALTAKTYKLHKSLINPNNLTNGKYDYHIDHKYSIYEGFKNNVDVNIISSKENLQMLYFTDNLSKSTTCSITLEKLLSRTRYLLKNDKYDIQ